MAAQYSPDEGPLSCIASAQAQLDVISRSGRQLLEIFACNEEPAVMAERVRDTLSASPVHKGVDPATLLATP